MANRLERPDFAPINPKFIGCGLDPRVDIDAIRVDHQTMGSWRVSQGLAAKRRDRSSRQIRSEARYRERQKKAPLPIPLAAGSEGQK